MEIAPGHGDEERLVRPAELDHCRFQQAVPVGRGKIRDHALENQHADRQVLGICLLRSKCRREVEDVPQQVV